MRSIEAYAVHMYIDRCGKNKVGTPGGKVRRQGNLLGISLTDLQP